MTIALVEHTQLAGPSGGGTTPAIVTTGASLLVLVISEYSAGPLATPTDSKGNTWIGLTAQTAASTYGRIFYAVNPTVGTGHTAALIGANSFCVVDFLAFSGVDTSSPFDVQNGASSLSGSASQAPGSVTPSANNSVVITGIASESPGTTATVDLSFVITDQSAQVNGVNFAGGAAYLIQTTATAVNPTWTYSSGTVSTAATIAVFKASAGSGTTLTPGVGSIILTGAAPTLAAGTTLTPGASSVVMAGLQPTVAAGTSISPGPGSLALTGFAPAVTSGAADVTLTPGLGALVLSGYTVTVTADGPPTPIFPQSTGFDAGGFGKWFNTAFASTVSNRRPARRETEIARMLDELVYGAEAQAALAALEPEDAEEAEEIVSEAARAVAERGAGAGTEREAMALVQSYADAYRGVLNVAQAEAWRLFMMALVERAKADWNAQIVRRIAQDDADLLILAQLVL